MALPAFIAATLYVFAFLQNSAWTDAAFPVAEALRNQYVWIVYLSYRESMFLWFLTLLIWTIKAIKKDNVTGVFTVNN